VGSRQQFGSPGNKKSVGKFFLYALRSVLFAVYLGDDLSLSDPRELLLF
jgi:hypothetical protein